MGRCYDPSRSILAGMDDTLLRQRLAQMQQDYLDLTSGRKVQTASYTQGDGGKNVTYTMANIGLLTAAIRQIQAQLGIIDSPRRALTVNF